MKRALSKPKIFMPYKISLGTLYAEGIGIRIEWCVTQFEKGKWRCDPAGWPGWIYFVDEQDYLMYLLRWGNE